MSIVNSNMFHWTPEDKLFSQYISSLPDNFRLTDEVANGCSGFFMESDKTGRRVLFIYIGTDLGGEEIAGWNFRPADSEIKFNPKLKGVKCLIIND